MFCAQKTEWNAANRLIEQTNEYGDITSYGYDGDGNYVYIGTALGSPAILTNDVTLALPEPLTASDEDGSWAQSYVYGAGNERISMTYAMSGDPSNAWEPVSGASGAGATGETNTLYYLSDMLGSVIGLEGADGTISARYHYDEFGVALDAEKLDVNWAGPDNLFGYTGLNYDSSSGLSYARARYFDSSIGRFISEDTYTGNRGNPQSLNLYAYVYNNPLVYIDITGNQGVKNQEPTDYAAQGIAIHKMVGEYFKIKFNTSGEAIAFTEVEVPVSGNISGYGRADMVLTMSKIKERFMNSNQYLIHILYMLIIRLKRIEMNRH